MRSQELAPYRSEFTVMVADRDDQAASELAKDVRGFGYTSAFSTAIGGSITLALTDPPHILLVDFDGPTEIEDYLTSMQDASPETLIILTIRAEQSLMAFELIEQGLAYDSVVKPFVSSLELSQKVDRAASELYHLFETEQLREFVSKKRGPKEIDDRSLNEFIAQIQGTKELDETTQIFIEALSHEWDESPVLYFKYLPTHASLPLALAAGQKIDKFRGLGIDLRKESPTSIVEFFRDPERAEPLQKFVKDVFSVDQFTAFTHTTEGEALGLFVSLTKEQKDIWNVNGRSLALKRVYDLAWKRNLTLKEKHTLDVSDGLTGVLNRRHFTQKLEDEISRSRRILMPLSAVVIDVDGFHQINERVGFQQADAILKAIAQILKKTTRVSDLIGRTGPDEFTLLLPHTGFNGAAVKSERIRRMVEATKFPLLGQGTGQVTVSIGISEYPSLSLDAESLLRSADEALHQVKEEKNKVCLATVPSDFKVDFSPREVRADELLVRR